jgi:flagellar hook-length control protein FliK
MSCNLLNIKGNGLSDKTFSELVSGFDTGISKSNRKSEAFCDLLISAKDPVVDLSCEPSTPLMLSLTNPYVSPTQNQQSMKRQIMNEINPNNDACLIGNVQSFEPMVNEPRIPIINSTVNLNESNLTQSVFTKRDFDISKDNISKTGRGIFNTLNNAYRFGSGSIGLRKSLKLEPMFNPEIQDADNEPILSEPNLTMVSHPKGKTILSKSVKVEAGIPEKKLEEKLDNPNTSKISKIVENKNTNKGKLVLRNNQEQANSNPKTSQTKPMIKDLNPKALFPSSLLGFEHSDTANLGTCNLVSNQGNLRVSKDERKSLGNDQNRKDKESSRIDAKSVVSYDKTKSANLKLESKGHQEPTINLDRNPKSKHRLPTDNLTAGFSTLKGTSDTVIIQPSQTMPHSASVWDNFLNFIEKVMQGARIIHRSEGLSELRVRMASDILGQVSIRLSVSDNQVDVKFTLDSSQAKQIMNEHKSELIQILKDQGADNVNIDVSTYSSQDWHQNQPSGGTGDQQRNSVFFTKDDIKIRGNGISGVENQVGHDEHRAQMYYFDGISSMVWVA